MQNDRTTVEEDPAELTTPERQQVRDEKKPADADTLQEFEEDVNEPSAEE